MKPIQNPTFFPTPGLFREWLDKNSRTATELIVGYYKVGTGKASMTWSQSVDEALCYGWIDGIRRTVDAESYCIRFTPRKPKSIWSAVNIAKVAALTKQGLMKPAGLARFAERREDKSAIYSYEKQAVPLSSEFEDRIKANSKAWNYLNAAAPSYRKIIANWIMSGKTEATRLKRLGELIADSEAGKKIKSQRY